MIMAEKSLIPSPFKTLRKMPVRYYANEKSVDVHGHFYRGFKGTRLLHGSAR
jgi:hypothetical protein